MELDEGNLNGKIYLFGTGKMSKNYTEILQQLSIKIYGYIDNDINKWGAYFFDKEIYPPNILKTEENTMVIIACSDIKTITNQIWGLGIKSKVVSIDYIIRKAIERLEIKSQQLEKPSIKCYQKKTIIVDNLNGSWGGAEDWAHELTSSLLKRGYDVDIIENMASKTGKELKQYTKRIDKKNRGISEVLVELIEWLLQRRPFTLFNIWSSEVLWAASYIKSIYPKEAQIIASVLNDTNNVYQRLCEWDDVIDIYLCISSKIKNNLIELYRINEKKVYYRSPFVEHVKNFEREFQTDNRIPLKIGFPCRLTRNQKRADLLPELIVKLEKKAVHYALNIVGSGEYEKDIIKFVNDSNLHSKISFFGKLSRKELLLFLNNQDIYLNLSDFEGTSLTMLEAMARGCVPVVTNVSGVDDFIENMINGMVSETGDIENIADNILFLDNNRDKLEIYSKRCMEIISFKCKLENYIDYIEKIIN